MISPPFSGCKRMIVVNWLQPSPEPAFWLWHDVTMAAGIVTHDHSQLTRLPWSGLARPGQAWPGLAAPGQARPGQARPGRAWPGLARADASTGCGHGSRSQLPS